MVEITEALPYDLAGRVVGILDQPRSAPKEYPRVQPAPPAAEPALRILS